ncbi:hypothetical protein [Ramlibacter tataouinensis]|nr:hypothetical protein [Ramlibacter tataouinensis]
MRSSLRSALLSRWAFIPGVVLLAASHVLAGLVAMAADDFDREPTAMENLLMAVPVIPWSWLLVLLVFHFKKWRRE